MTWPKTFPPLPPELAKLWRESLLRDLNQPDFDASLWCGPPGSGKPLIVEPEPETECESSS